MTSLRSGPATSKAVVTEAVAFGVELAQIACTIEKVSDGQKIPGLDTVDGMIREMHQSDPLCFAIPNALAQAEVIRLARLLCSESNLPKVK